MHFGVVIAAWAAFAVARPSEGDARGAVASGDGFAHRWEASGVLDAGGGVGWCLHRGDTGSSRSVGRVVVRRTCAGSPVGRYRLYSVRDHAYAMAFVLDARRDLGTRPDGSGMIASQRKLRLDVSGDLEGEVLALDVVLERGSTLHVYVASNRLEGACGYEVEVESDAPLAVAPEPTGGWRGVPAGVPPAHCADALARATGASRLLCVDGGGARGVVPLAVLAECERQTRCRAREEFDFLAGTSTGAIVAAGLALAELPVGVARRGAAEEARGSFLPSFLPSFLRSFLRSRESHSTSVRPSVRPSEARRLRRTQVQRLYDDLVRLIFGSKGLSPTQRARRLEAVLTAVFGGESTLGGRPTRTRGSSGSKLVILATDASTARLRPFVFRNFEPPEELEGDYLVDAGSHTCKVVDALLASTAAPPFFPMRKFDVDGVPRRLLDGALVANNPTQFALAEAAAVRRCGAAPGERPAPLDLVVSLGTGAAPAKVVTSAAEARSFLTAIPQTVTAARDFVEGIANLLTDTDTTHDLVKRQLRNDCHATKDLHETYHRLDAVIDAKHLKLNEGDSNVLRDLRAMALDYLKRDKAHDWRALVDALKKRRGPVAARPPPKIVDLDDETEYTGTLATIHHTALRPLRKTCARLTGLHGFFSKKPHR